MLLSISPESEYIKELIPKIGPRLKFIKGLKQYKDESTHGNKYVIIYDSCTSEDVKRISKIAIFVFLTEFFYIYI